MVTYPGNQDDQTSFFVGVEIQDSRESSPTTLNLSVHFFVYWGCHFAVFSLLFSKNKKFQSAFKRSILSTHRAAPEPEEKDLCQYFFAVSDKVTPTCQSDLPWCSDWGFRGL